MLCTDFCLFIRKKCSYYPHNLWVTGPIFIRFAEDVAKVLSWNVLKLAISQLFRNANVLNKGIFPNFAIKLVAMATAFGKLSKEI